MFPPRVVPIFHSGGSPYAPPTPYTPAQKRAHDRCAPLTSPPPVSVPVDAWTLEDDSEKLL